jgi:integrase/recombinase XerC/integrase/recombinase XerD
MLYLEYTGHNEGGRHACYRALKTFLYWWEEELEPEGWKNPIRRVKPPRLSVSPLEPVEMEDVKAMIASCDGSFYGRRDKAILLSLLDTGARAHEFLAINMDDFDYKTGEILIREGKGSKFRTVFLRKKARRTVRAYLRERIDDSPAFWIIKEGERLSYWGLREIIRRHATKAGVKTPTIHSFRRAFALNMLRAGVDIFSLQKLMGHADLQVLRRYLAQTTEDIAQAHRLGSPVDNSQF